MNLIITIYTQTLATSLCMEQFSLCRDYKDKIWDQMNLYNGSLVSQLPRKYWLAHMNTTYITMKKLPPNNIWRYDIEMMGLGTTCLACQVLCPLLKPTYIKCQQTIRCEHWQTCSLGPLIHN